MTFKEKEKSMNAESKKRVIAVHDISCIGRCSLTVALPVLSAAGIETSVIPTAVLSTHTGGFYDFTFRDLTDDIEPIFMHWKTLGIGCDSIYTGYLGSFRQVEIVEKLISEMKTEKTFVLVDPVMGDSGRLYTGIDEKLVLGMKKLCAAADMVVPNITEASMMLGMPYIAEGYSKDYINTMLTKLCKIGPRYAVLSGVSFEKGKTGAASYDALTDSFSYYFTDETEGFYHGTGDLFASALLGAFLSGKTISDSIKIAVDYTAASIKITHDFGSDTRYGVDFELSLPGYMKALGRI
jgi:pyridoxine kinase